MKYHNRLKAQNQNKPEVEVNLKENPKNKDRTHLKPKRQMKLIHMIALTIIITMIITLPQVRVEAADPLMVKAVTDNLEVSHNETKVKDLNIVNVNFRTIDFREAHFNRTVLNTATIVNPTLGNSYRGRSHGRGPQQFIGCGHGRANYQSGSEVYQYQYYMYDRTVWPTL